MDRIAKHGQKLLLTVISLGLLAYIVGELYCRTQGCP